MFALSLSQGGIPIVIGKDVKAKDGHPPLSPFQGGDR